MRVDLYSLVHKGQRHRLFELSNEIGKADFKNPAEAEKLSQQVLGVIEHLKDHAKNEETYIHPLYTKLGNNAEFIEKEHHDLDSDFEDLKQIIESKRWDELYSEYTLFLGRYLLHLAAEEKAQRDILWKHYDDQALMAVFGRFKAERSPQAAKEDLELMLPALNITELTRMFAGMKASASAQVFKGACEIASYVLDLKKWQKLKAEILD